MPWEMHDGRRAIGPMSEDAVIWAIKRGLPSETQVRQAGHQRWTALDDHPPFADELIARSAGQRTRKKKSSPLGYTWKEFVAMGAVIIAVGAMVFGIGWLEKSWTKARQVQLSDVMLAVGEHDVAPGGVTPAATMTPVEPVRAPAARTPVERANLASKALRAPKADPRVAVCRAHALLDSIPEEERKKPEVARVVEQLWSAEMPLLRQDLAEFDKRRGVVCGDGTRPTGCPCKGAHAACCVLHGGTASCEPPPTKIRCM
jgi:hypothetical protein